MGLKQTTMYAILVVIFICAFIIVFLRSWLAEVAWTFAELMPGTRPATELPFEAQVMLMIVIIVAGIAVAAWVHKRVTAR